MRSSSEGPMLSEGREKGPLGQSLCFQHILRATTRAMRGPKPWKGPRRENSMALRWPTFGPSLALTKLLKILCLALLAQKCLGNLKQATSHQLGACMNRFWRNTPDDPARARYIDELLKRRGKGNRTRWPKVAKGEQQMKQRDEQWVWLTAAAMDCRDSLRSRIVPGLDKAATMRGDELREHLQQLRDVALVHTNRLLYALKGRSAPRTARRDGGDHE